MQLNLPGLDQLSACRSVLIAGMGGGFDLFCGLPIYFELRKRGVQAHLASFSLALISQTRGGERLSRSLVGIGADYRGIATYFPEFYLTRWFRETRAEEVRVWCLGKTGALSLVADYRLLVEHLGLDGIVLVDGGVDSLSRGDEDRVGTVLEDGLSLCAVNQLDQVPTRLLACLGFGAEREVSHAHILENIAALAAEGGFLGSCSLVQQMEAVQAYESALEYVHAQPLQEPGVVNASVLSAVRGHYGDYHLLERTRGSRLWISPLMAMYWVFDLPAVAKRNLFLDEISWTDTSQEAMRALMMWRQKISQRPPFRIPLP